MEIEIIKFFQSYRSMPLDVFFGIFSYFASYIGLVFSFFLIFYYNKKYSIFYLVNYAIIMFLNTIIKIIINRPRPYEIDNEIISIITASGRSFPSGHMTSASIMVVFILFLILKLCKNKKTKLLSIILGVLFLVFVSISRLYLGQHYLSDIIGGAILGIGLSTFVLTCFNKIITKKLFKNSV